VIFIAVWQLIFDEQWLNRLFVPHPYAVLVGLENLVSGGLLWHNLAVSGEEFGLGLGISIGIGAILGIASGWYKPLEEFLRPMVVGLNSMPQIAIIPLLILIFGIGVTPKVVVVILSCTVTIILNTAAGVESADPHLLRLSRSFGASDLQVIKTVILPSVVPFFMTGVRISVGRAVVSVVVGEIFASRAGLGNLLINASDSFNMPLMYATLVILTAIGIILTQGATRLERRMQRWQE
jgi:NitT/TauT family transport system permease protein